MIGIDQLDLEGRFVCRDEVVDGHLCGADGGLATQIGIHTGHVRQHADLDDIVGEPGSLCAGSARARNAHGGDENFGKASCHFMFLWGCRVDSCCAG